ncbi:Protein ANTAGONIST OF LIKE HETEROCHROMATIN PROTEIN 1 [Gonioctena quinquepunctata]|nr:Protein ANTAGONIST OF LIKE HETEROCHROMATIN PROTEIN 1 [Gonioctena quinquepunctata]
MEAFLFSPDFGEDNYLLASSSSSSSDDSDEECSCSNEANILEKTSKKFKRSDGFAEAIVPTFQLDEFRSHFRVNRTTFEKILEMIHTSFSSEHKGGWDRIYPEKAAYILLWYLGNQETFKQISERFKITMSCIHNIVKIGTRNISENMSEHILWPSVREYPTISNLYEDTCELKNIIGAIGVSHIKIPKPKEQMENYICKNNYYSIALQGTVTINKKFIDIFITEGSKEPEDILNQSSIPLEADNGLFQNYFLIGHKTHSNHPWLIQPVEEDGNLHPTQTHFNVCYETGFGIVLESFGLLKGRFQRLQHFENRDVPFIKQCVEAACVIHNLCIDCEDEEDFFFPDTGLFEGCLTSTTHDTSDDFVVEEVNYNFPLDNVEADLMS